MQAKRRWRRSRQRKATLSGTRIDAIPSSHQRGQESAKINGRWCLKPRGSMSSLARLQSPLFLCFQILKAPFGLKFFKGEGWHLFKKCGASHILWLLGSQGPDKRTHPRCAPQRGCVALSSAVRVLVGCCQVRGWCIPVDNNLMGSTQMISTSSGTNQPASMTRCLAISGCAVYTTITRLSSARLQVT